MASLVNQRKEFAATMLHNSWKSYLGLTAKLAMISALTLPVSTTLEAAPPERPTFNHTADPRPNILPDWIYNHHEPYRLQYNRPTYHVGKAMYYVISPTSQEALSWKENLDEGRYNGHHCPPVYKGYYYPKPWEVLNTGPRPTFATPQSVNVQPVPNQVPAQVPAP